MKQRSLSIVSLLCLAATASLSSAAQGLELTNNGDFELGNTNAWVSFPSPNSTFTVTNDVNSGAFAGRLENLFAPSAAVIKQANLGIGVVQPGDPITISFAAKGTFGVGGVAFAEFFSELAGGGTSSSQILGNAPLNLSGSWQTFSFMTVAGPDVSGGVTLQFAAATGAITGSTAELFIDDVSVSVPGAPTQNYCGPAVPNSTGASAGMSATGSFTVASNDTTLMCGSLPNNATAFFLTSRTQAFVVSPGGSAGNLCLGGMIGRYVGPGQILNSGGFGSVQLAINLSAHPTPMGPVAVASGETWNFQCWFRDSAGGVATSNFSDGLAITFQ